MRNIQLVLIILTLTSIFQSCQSVKPTTISNTPVVLVAAAPMPEVKKDSVIVKEPIALTVGSREVPVSDFKKIFDSRKDVDSLSNNDLLNQLIFEQQLITSAKNRGIDKEEDYINELQSNRDVLSQRYLLDSTLTKSLMKEAYQWMQTEVKAAHIMIPIAEGASPADTLKTYNQLLEIRNRGLSGENFGALAANYSYDEKTKNKNGEFDWFTALQLIYPLEKAAYTTSVGDISMPVRVKGAYHIVKVLEKRPNSGKVQVAQIEKVIPADASETVKNDIQLQITAIADSLKKGGNFEVLCKAYSDDYNSKYNNGLLPEFGIGTRLESNFENMAFSLKEGEISAPFQTSKGWHIIKVIKKTPLESFDAMYRKLFDKVQTDSRGEYLKEQSFNKFKSKMNFVENTAILDKAISRIDSSIYSGKWNYALNDEIVDYALFSYSSKKATVREFFEHVYSTQKSAAKERLTPTAWGTKSYHVFVDSTLKSFVNNNLEKVDSDFDFEVKQFGNEMLINRILTQRVYEASLDTIAQRTFYEINKPKYQLGERAYATIFKAKDEKTFKSLDELLTKGIPYQLKRGIQPIYFTKYVSDLTVEDKKRLVGLVVILAKNPDYIVEIGGHADVNEGDNISAERMKKVVDFLIANGLPLNRMMEYDYKKTKIADKFDWSKNQRVSFQFFSNSKKDLIKVFNSKDPNTLDVEEGYFDKGKNEVINKAEWKKGSYNVSINNYFYKLHIDRVEAARPKTIREARTQVILDYQNQLLNQLKEELKQKYPIKSNTAEIEQIITSKK